MRPLPGRRLALRHEVVAVLRCPLGEPELALAGRGLVCAAGHRFDLARQGYANLLQGGAPAAADTAAMVAARTAVQEAGHLDPITDALLAAVSGGGAPRVVLDVGAGTGHHLAAVLEATGADVGVAVDLSKYAARRAARAHPRVGAVVADAWAGLPVRDRVVDLALAVFAPRGWVELDRVLRPGARSVVVTPAADHLAPLVAQLGLLAVEPDKLARLDREVPPRATLIERTRHRWTRRLDRPAVADLVAMGPSAHHVPAGELAALLEALPDPVTVGFAVDVSAYGWAN